MGSSSPSPVCFVLLKFKMIAAAARLSTSEPRVSAIRC